MMSLGGVQLISFRPGWPVTAHLLLASSPAPPACSRANKRLYPLPVSFHLVDLAVAMLLNIVPKTNYSALYCDLSDSD